MVQLIPHIKSGYQIQLKVCENDHKRRTKAFDLIERIDIYTVVGE